MMNIIRIDPFVLPDRNVYYYQSKPVDICGKEYDLSKFNMEQIPLMLIT